MNKTLIISVGALLVFFLIGSSVALLVAKDTMFSTFTKVTENSESNSSGLVTVGDGLKLSSPKKGSKLVSPLTLTGEAVGGWYFEASFPIAITDDKGKTLASSYVSAQGEWMTEKYVPFDGKIEFTVPKGVTKGFLVLMKDNPSGDPSKNYEVKIPVTF